VEARGTSVVERAVELFSKLDAELDGLEAEVRAWGRQLLSQADRLSADARVKLLEAARARGEERLREIERRANAEAEEMLRGEERKLEDLRAAFEAKRERLVELALGMLLPRED
jgi:F0F1-type ATP synthase membrane subunit b/b'